MTPLNLSFYQREDVLAIGKELLGKFLFSCIDGNTTGGMIIETESYKGAEDKASHAYGNRKTERTKVLFEKGGISYVYLCYGIHHLLNVVTNQEEVPHAVLIRAIKPLVGIEIMLKRRKKEILTSILTGGPGSLTEALGITRMHNRLPFSGPLLWIEDRGISFSSKQIIASPRIGVEYAQEDAYLPYRFQLQIDLFQNALCLD